MNTGPLYFIHVNLAAALLLALVVLVAGLTTAKNIPVISIGTAYHITLSPVVVWSDSWVTALSVPLCVLLDAG